MRKGTYIINTVSKESFFGSYSLLFSLIAIIAHIFSMPYYYIMPPVFLQPESTVFMPI
jgi:hypothetical protein